MNLYQCQKSFYNVYSIKPFLHISHTFGLNLWILIRVYWPTIAALKKTDQAFDPKVKLYAGKINLFGLKTSPSNICIVLMLFCNLIKFHSVGLILVTLRWCAFIHVIQWYIHVINIFLFIVFFVQFETSKNFSMF